MSNGPLLLHLLIQVIVYGSKSTRTTDSSVWPILSRYWITAKSTVGERGTDASTRRTDASTSANGECSFRSLDHNTSITTYSRRGAEEVAVDVNSNLCPTLSNSYTSETQSSSPIHASLTFPHPLFRRSYRPLDPQNNGDTGRRLHPISTLCQKPSRRRWRLPPLLKQAKGRRRE